jgi:hypothetical protein
MSLPQTQRGLPTRMLSWLSAGKMIPIPQTTVYYNSTSPPNPVYYLFPAEDFDIAITGIVYAHGILAAMSSTAPTISVGTHTKDGLSDVAPLGKPLYPASILAAQNIGLTSPKGTVVRFDAASMAATWKNPANAVQTITMGSGSGTDTYKLAFNGSEKTGTIQWDVADTVVQAALCGLSTIGPGGCSVTRTGTTPNFIHTVTFTGKNGYTDQPMIVSSDLSGMTADVMETVQGHPSPPLDFRGFPVIPKNNSVVVTLTRSGAGSAGIIQGHILYRPIE